MVIHVYDALVLIKITIYLSLIESNMKNKQVIVYLLD